MADKPQQASVFKKMMKSAERDSGAVSGIAKTLGIAGGWGAGAAVVATGVCAATAPVCIGVAALVGGILASVGTDLLFGTLYVSPQGRN